MTLIPDLERDLLHAAGRASRRRRRRAGLVAVGGAAGAVATAVLLLSVANDAGGPPERPQPAAPATPCELGKAPSVSGEWHRFDRRPVRSLTVVGCARLDDGTRVELVARKFRRGRCLDVFLPGHRAALECAADPLTGKRPAPVAVSALTPPGTVAAKRVGRPLLIGWTRWDVKRVEARYRAAGSARRREVTLIRVTTVPLVLAAGEHRPFGVFVLEPRADTQALRLVALAAKDKRLGTARLPGGS